VPLNVSSEDSCTRCTNWVVGVDLWKVYFNFLFSIYSENRRGIYVRFRSPSFRPQKTITTWLTKTEIFTLHWINIIIRNNKCIFILNVSSEDSCTRCTNWVVGVDLWKVYFNFLLKKRISFLFINVFHQRKNKLWETLSQVLFVESNHLNYLQ
jgi:hypothetical protein